MQYISYYHSPIGNILLASDNIGLTGLWFENQKYYAYNLDQEHQEKELPIFEQTKKWLDIYFSGKRTQFYTITPYGRYSFSDYSVENFTTNTIW